MSRVGWFCVAAFVGGCAVPEPGVEWLATVRHMPGDSPGWAAPGFDDSGWPSGYFWEVPHPERTLWVRAEVRLPDRPADLQARSGPIAVTVTALASRELWWDGVLIGRDGAVGRTPEEEIPGPIEAHHVVPDSLAGPGAHRLAIRASAFHQGFTPSSDFLRLGVGPLVAVVLQRREGAWLALVSTSGILLAVLLAFVMFGLNRHDRSSLLLGLLGLAVAALLAAEAWRPLFGYAYPRHVARLVAIAALTCMVSALLAAFVIARFRRRLSPWLSVALAAALAAALFVAPSWDGKALGVHAVGLIFSGGWTFRAVLDRRRGAIIALAGISIALVLLARDPRAFLDRNYFFAIDGLLMALLVGHLLEWRAELAAREQSLARSARLEAELLKRQLQPHFVMNTLTAIGGWVEEDPTTAVRMIDALADELRMLSRIADHRLIPLGDELALCRAHLRTLELRRETRYTLETHGVDELDAVPPALIHTLVENAVTHGPPQARQLTLRLEADRHAGRIRYSFTSARGDGVAEIAPGTGTRYVTARLREAWGEDWTLTQEPDGEWWRVTIDVPGTRP